MKTTLLTIGTVLILLSCNTNWIDNSNQDTVEQLIEKQQLFKALELVNEKIKTSNEDPDLYFLRGTIKTKLYNFTGAIEDYHTANMNSMKTIYMFNKGAVFSEMGKYDQAEVEFNSIAKFMDENVHFYIELAKLEARKGNFENGKIYLTRANQLEPNLQDTFYAGIYLLLLEKKYADVIDIVDNYEGSLGDSYLGYLRARALYETEEYTAALDQIISSYQILPDPKYLVLKAQILNKKGQAEKAIAMLKNVTKKYGNFGEAYYCLATIYLEREDQKMACHFKRMSEINGNNRVSFLKFKKCL